MSEKEPPKNYRTGYKKPPLKGRFKKGQSGNPRGRPRQKKTRRDIAEKWLSKRVTMTINGEQHDVTCFEATFIAQLNKAIQKSDARAFKFVTDAAKEHGLFLDEDQARKMLGGVIAVPGMLTEKEWEAAPNESVPVDRKVIYGEDPEENGSKKGKSD